jgi:phosphoribosylamine--glycine ligase
MKQTQNPKNILYITLSSIITSVARRSSLEWHCVKYYIEDEKDQEVGDWFLDKVKNPDDRVDWADLIVFDDVLGQWKKAQSLRKQWKLVIWWTEYTDMLEDDKNFWQSEMKKHWIKILDYKEYHTFDEAIADIKKNPWKYVLKPSGEAQNIKRLLFVWQEDDWSDVIKILKAYRETWSEEVKVFQLQKKVTSWVEIAVWAFFNWKKFLTPLNINFEHKKLFPWELWVATGEMGTSMFWTWPNKLFNLTLKKFESTLAKEWYVWYIDINCIVNGSWIYPLEFTCRFWCPTIAIQSDWIVWWIWDFFYTLAAGTTHEFKYKKW